MGRKLVAAVLAMVGGAVTLLTLSGGPAKASGSGDVVAVALGDLGVSESPPGSNRGPKIDAWLRDVGQPPGQEWCAAWVSSVLRRAGMRDVHGSASVHALADQFRALGRLRPPGSAAPPGSVVFWDRGNGKGHTGIVIRDLGATLETIEGNSDLGNVRRRSDRKKGDPSIMGFGSTAPARAAKSGTVLLVGDSMAGGLSTPLRDRLGAKAGFKNGSTIDRWATGPELQAAIAAYRPTVGLVSLGTNDMSTPVPEYKRAMVRKILDAFKTQGAEVVWLLPPTMPFPDHGALRIIAEEVQASGGTVIHAPDPLPRGSDKIHPTPMGFATWADKIAASVQSTGATHTASASAHWGWDPASPDVAPGSVLAVPGLTADDVPALLNAAKALNVSADALAAVISFESTWRPWAINGIQADAKGRRIPGPYLGRYLLTKENQRRIADGRAPFFAVGLNQLTLGARLPGFDTNEKLLAAAEWPASRQLREIVVPYYRRMDVKGVTPGKLYMLNLLPEYANAPPDTIIGDRDSPDAFTRAVFAQNAGFSKDGRVVTVRDVHDAIRSRIAASHGIRIAPGKTGATPVPESIGRAGGSRVPRFGDLSDPEIYFPQWDPVKWRGLRVMVGRDALKADVNGRAVRIPVSWDDATALFRRFNLAPMIEELSDAVYANAWRHLEPRPQKNVDDTIDTVTRYNAAIDAQIPSDYDGIVSDVGKDLVAHNRVLLSKPRGLAMYGWRRIDGTPIQGRNPLAKAKHPASYRDYSHTFRPVQRYAIGPNGPVDLLAVYASDLGLSPETWAPEPSHEHKCDRCGETWAHTDAARGDVAAHTCPRCGAQQWIKA